MKTKASEDTPLLSDGSEYSTVASATYNLLVTAVGASVMVLPFTLMSSGYILGSLGLVFNAWLTWISLAALAYCSVIEKRSEYTDLVGAVLGTPGLVACQVCLVLVLYGAMCMYIIIAGNLLQPFVSSFMNLFELHLVMAGLTLAGSLSESLHGLRWLSTIAMGCMCFVLVAVVFRAATKSTLTYSTMGANSTSATASPSLSAAAAAAAAAAAHTPIRAFDFGMGFALSLPVQGLAFGCHMQIPRLVYELRPTEKVKIFTIIKMIMALSVLFYLVVALCHFYFVNGHPSDDLLSDYPTTDSIINSARIMVSAIMILKGPLTLHPLRSTLLVGWREFQNFRNRRKGAGSFATPGRSSAQNRFPPTTPGAKSRVGNIVLMVALSSVILFLVVVGITVVPNLSSVMGVMGSTVGCVIAFIVPGLLLWYVCTMASEAERSSRSNGLSPVWAGSVTGRVTGAFLVTAGLLMGVLGLVAIGKGGKQ
mmetsp:Transcript_78/g.134  ORF Transcript_78/g.134 Transcript_78/m.134 type:complete len:480 (+) Transcript_78:48-1487(+)